MTIQRPGWRSRDLVRYGAPTIAIHNVTARDADSIRLQYVSGEENKSPTPGAFTCLHLAGLTIYFDGYDEENARNCAAFVDRLRTLGAEA